MDNNYKKIRSTDRDQINEKSFDKFNIGCKQNQSKDSIFQDKNKSLLSPDTSRIIFGSMDAKINFSNSKTYSNKKKMSIPNISTKIDLQLITENSKLINSNSNSNPN